jgi:hypothetical protein
VIGTLIRVLDGTIASASTFANGGTVSIRLPQMPRLSSSYAPVPFRKLKVYIRVIALLLLCALTLLGLKKYAARFTAATLLDPHLEKSQFTCSMNTTDAPAPAVRVVITNFHPSTSVSLLIWDSPFDGNAVALGAFDINDTASGTPVATIGTTMSRLLPPTADDFIEILPLHAVAKDISLQPPDVSLESGKTYSIKARGRWKAVWHARLSDFDPAYLQKLGGATGLIDWNYESNIVEVAVE